MAEPEQTEQAERWNAGPVRAWLVQATVFLLPILTSAGYVYAVSRLAPPPVGSLGAYLGWWFALSGSATLVLAAARRASRRLMPLAALLRLALVFPDRAPSRFRIALNAGTVTTLEQRLEQARQGAGKETPAEAAKRLLSLVAALDAHDKLTRGHSERVRAYARLIGGELGLTPRAIDLLNWAALLHDIGKLEVPHEILAKNGRPTDEEWALIKRHPEFGETLVAPLREWLGEWCDAVGHHHERWDGGGYPRGIAGNEIPLAGRIVAVADVFDVITSSRSYKQASAASAGRKEIAACAGAQFDPEIVRAFLGASLPSARLASGPLSWLADAAVLARAPLTSAAATLSAAAVVVSGPALSGITPGQDGPPNRSAAVPTRVGDGAVRTVARSATSKPAEQHKPARTIRSARPAPATVAVSTRQRTARDPEPAGASKIVEPPARGQIVASGLEAKQAIPHPTSPGGAKTTTPTVPSLPPVPALPELPSVPSLPQLPPVPELPRAPTLPPVPEPPSTPAPPELPAPPGSTALPSVGQSPDSSVPATPSTPPVSVPSLPLSPLV